MHKRNIFFLCIVPLFAQEPSAFHAGGTQPIKTDIEILNEKVFSLTNELNFLKQSFEGMKSVFENQIQRIQDSTQNIGKINNLLQENNATASKFATHVNDSFDTQNQNLESLKSSIVALGALLEKNNQEVRQEVALLKKEIGQIKDELNTTSSQMHLLQDRLSSISKPQEVSKEASKENPKKETTDANKSIADTNTTILDPKKVTIDSIEGKEAFRAFNDGEEFYKQKKYQLAKKNLKYAIEKKYKPARGNYLMGEIAFEEKKYQDAIYYYKESATRYDKAEYMPRLMLHSAKSFLELKDKESAQRFLDSLVSLYPNTKEAKEAKKISK